ncbi:MAG: AsmA-like C-terminal domain-containing protein [Desulfomonilaceae bacterium]
MEINAGTLVLTDQTTSGPSASKNGSLIDDLYINCVNLNQKGIDSFQIKGRAKEFKTAGLFEIKGSFSFQNPSNQIQTPRIFSVKFSDCPMRPFLLLANYFQIEIPISRANFSFALDASYNHNKWDFSGVCIISGGFVQSNKLIRSRVAIDKIGSRFAGEISDKNLSIDLQEISIPGVVASLKFRLKDRLSPKSLLETTISRAEIDIQKISAFLPLSLFPAPDRARIKKADLKGHIQIVNSFFSNSLQATQHGDFKNADMNFDVILNGVSGVVPGYPVSIQEASGFMRLNPSEILFKGIRFSLGSSPVIINGWISNLKKAPAVDLFVTANAYAPDILEVLSHKPFRNKFAPYVQAIIDSQGSAAITMDVKGPLTNPILTGRVAIQELQFKTEWLALPIRKINGDIRFRGVKVTFSGVKGLIGDSPFEFNGELSQSDWNLKVDCKLASPDIRKLGIIPTDLNITGNTPISLIAKGKTPNLGFAGSVDLSAAAISYVPYVKKKTGIATRIDFSGNRNPEGISIDEVYLITDACRISGKMVLNYDGKFIAAVNLPPKGVPTSALIPFAHPALEMQTGGRLEGDLTIRREKNREANFEANIIFSHVSLRIPGLRKATEGITGSYQKRSKFVNVSIERSRTGSSLISGNFSIAEGSTPILKFTIESDFLDTTDFTAPPGEKSSVTWQEWIRTNSFIRYLAKSQLSGNIHVIKGKTQLRSFEDFRCELSGGGGLVKATKWQMNFADGIVRGIANFDIRFQTTVPLRIDFQGGNLSFERIFTSAQETLKVDGGMDVTGNMDWKLRAVFENNGIYKTGTLNIDLRDGIIYKFDILSKIFSLINLGSLMRGHLPDIVGHGLPFQRITWKSEVFDNKWIFKDLRLFSDAARIDASGMYFSDQNRIDFKVKVSPLVGLDAIVSGLFGNLITKDGKILTTTFRIRGLYSSPDIRLEPFENLKMEN